MTDQYRRYYDLEDYLFEDVHRRFHETGKLDAFDLFSIIIWKANRAKSRLAHRLMVQFGDLESAASQLSEALSKASSPEQRFLLTMNKFGFYLPMASAILTVLWPDDFSVFDYRVCEELNQFENLDNLTPTHAWPQYLLYCAAVANHPDVSQFEALRDKDRFFWGRSAALQLVREIENGFRTTSLSGSDMSPFHDPAGWEPVKTSSYDERSKDN